MFQIIYFNVEIIPILIIIYKLILHTYVNLFEINVYFYYIFLNLGTQSSPIMPGGATPGTPSAKQKEKPIVRSKVVVALYNYKAIETGDLSLEKVRLLM